jgi:hypothetical protein
MKLNKACVIGMVLVALAGCGATEKPQQTTNRGQINHNVKDAQEYFSYTGERTVASAACDNKKVLSCLNINKQQCVSVYEYANLSCQKKVKPEEGKSEEFMNGKQAGCMFAAVTMVTSNSPFEMMQCFKDGGVKLQ